jgi:hypothetical protein
MTGEVLSFKFGGCSSEWGLSVCVVHWRVSKLHQHLKMTIDPTFASRPRVSCLVLHIQQAAWDARRRCGQGRLASTHSPPLPVLSQRAAIHSAG